MAHEIRRGTVPTERFASGEFWVVSTVGLRVTLSRGLFDKPTRVAWIHPVLADSFRFAAVVDLNQILTQTFDNFGEENIEEVISQLETSPSGCHLSGLRSVESGFNVKLLP